MIPPCFYIALLEYNKLLQVKVVCYTHHVTENRSPGGEYIKIYPDCVSIETAKKPSAVPE